MSALDAISEARRAMREHSLVMPDECVLCRRMIDNGGQHTSDCAYARLEHAERQLTEFQRTVIY